MRKVIFLDIDGVLNSYRTCTAYDSFPKQNDSTEKFDMVAVKLIEVACKKCNAEIVLSSTWRMAKNWEKLGETLNLPIVDKTPCLKSGSRGEEIAMWLRDNLVFEYVIVDDDPDMLESQMDRFIHCDHHVGLGWDQWSRIREIWPEVDDHKRMSGE